MSDKEALCKANACGDPSSGIGQRAGRSPQLACIRLGWIRLGLVLRRKGVAAGHGTQPRL